MHDWPTADRSGGRRYLLVALPPEVASWDQLPQNPLEGLSGPPDAPLAPEEYPFYCDPCQKGFHHERQFTEHRAEHVYCSVPGCNFTLHKRKEWKMELHMEALHNRPDAPNLHDVGEYLKQRKQRFPTHETVASKMEELFYKASRGEVLPDERRRWMRQHGVIIKKRPRTDEAFIFSNAGRGEHVDPKPPKKQTVPIGAPATSPAPFVRKKMIPLGMNGKLSHAQRLQLVREKYRDAVRVHPFYVCNRCGEKGKHFVNECPTIGDDAFDRVISWGEARKQRAEENDHDVAVAQGNDEPVERKAERELDRSSEVMQAQSVTLQDIDKPTTLPSNALKGPHEGRRAPRRPSKLPPTFYEKLAGDDKLHSRGLLLQAIRFFIFRNFFEEDRQTVSSAQPSPAAAVLIPDEGHS